MWGAFSGHQVLEAVGCRLYMALYYVALRWGCDICFFFLSFSLAGGVVFIHLFEKGKTKMVTVMLVP